MTLLVDFLCRFGWGLAVALTITPAALVPAGFFRVNLLVVLGLATFAALLAGRMPPTAGWTLPAAAAVTAWLGSIAWLAERVPAGRVFCAVAAALMAAATAMVHAAGGWSAAAAGPTAAALLSGLVTGLTVHAMLLGHWYLNAPGMRVDVLRRMIDAALVAWGVQLAATLALAVAQPGHPLAPAALVAVAPTAAATVGQTTVALLWLRWLAGLVGLPVLLWLARKTLEIPNTQSATGILYVACLAAILGELTAQLLTAPA
jgi:hypothetical protein